MKKGIFITFEGNEGCGKTTQINKLYKACLTAKLKVFLVREPGGTIISDSIRAVLLDTTHKKMVPNCEAMLYMASRAQLVEEVIRPKLKDGHVVLCDRWLDSTIVYQGYGEGVDIDWIKALGQKIVGDIKPDCTFYLDIPLLCGLRRAKSHKKADRIEKKKIDFHQRVRDGYEDLLQDEPHRIKKIFANELTPIKDVHSEIVTHFNKILEKKGARIEKDNNAIL